MCARYKIDLVIHTRIVSMTVSWASTPQYHLYLVLNTLNGWSSWGQAYGTVPRQF